MCPLNGCPLNGCPLNGCPLNGCALLYLIISGLLVRLILLLVTSILTNQEAVLRRFVLTIYDYFMQQQGLSLVLLRRLTRCQGSKISPLSSIGVFFREYKRYSPAFSFLIIFRFSYGISIVQYIVNQFFG